MNDLDTMMQELAEVRLPELQAKFAEVVGKKTRTPNKKFLLRKIREALETQQTAAGETNGDATTLGKPTQGTREDEMPAKPARDADGRDPDEAAPLHAEKNKRRKAPIRPQQLEQDGMPPQEVVKRLSGLKDREQFQEQFAKALGEPPRAQGPSLKDLDVPTLQQKYVEIVGRPTGSSNKNYLMWKIRMAQQGKVPVGPRPSRSSTTPGELKVLALRMPANFVAALDEVWRRHGMKSRMELIRDAFEVYLGGMGELDVAGLVRGSSD